MADETTDKSQKTEDPTQKRVEDARQKGQIATSREVNNWFMILAATMLVGLVLPGTMAALDQSFRMFIEQPHQGQIQVRFRGRLVIITRPI